MKKLMALTGRGQTRPENSSGNILTGQRTDIRCYVAGGASAIKEGDTMNAPRWLYSVLGFLRWRRLISPLAAVTRKPAVLSPSSFNFSISSITSCGIRTVVICDFAFFAPVAITRSPHIRCMSVYAKRIIKKGLKCISLMCSVKNEGEIHLEITKPGSVGARTGPLTTNDNYTIEAAMKNNTTAPQRFIFLFLAVMRANTQAHPHREQISATSEREARSLLAGRFVLIFAGRLPVREVVNA